MMCENAVNARVPVAVPGARGSSPLLKKVAGAVAATAALGAATAAYGHFIELNNFQLRTESLPVLPAGSPDFRILHISDMHMIPGQQKKIDFMHSLAALEPDLVMNTGDNLSHVDGMGPLLEALDPLMDFPGVFVPGSNCYFAPVFKNPARYLWQPRTPQMIEEGSRVALPIERMHDAFESRGWTGLINRYDTLNLKGLRLEFSGVDDPHLRYDEHPGFAPGAFDEGDEPSVRIGVAHAPYMRTLHRFVQDGAQAIFCRSYARRPGLPARRPRPGEQLRSAAFTCEGCQRAVRCSGPGFCRFGYIPFRADTSVLPAGGGPGDPHGSR